MLLSCRSLVVVSHNKTSRRIIREHNQPPWRRFLVAICAGHSKVPYMNVRKVLVGGGVRASKDWQPTITYKSNTNNFQQASDIRMAEKTSNWESKAENLIELYFTDSSESGATTGRMETTAENLNICEIKGQKEMRSFVTGGPTRGIHQIDTTGQSKRSHSSGRIHLGLERVLPPRRPKDPKLVTPQK